MVIKYTPEEVDLLTTWHVDQNLSAAEIAEKLNHPVRSVRGKLVSLGIYRKPIYLTKLGEIPVKKEEYVERICKCLKIDPSVGDSLAKCNKGILRSIAERLERLERLEKK
jgi:hypothetical protein